MCLPLYLYVGIDTTLCLVSWSVPRYRLPSDAVMMVFAALAVVNVAPRLAAIARAIRRRGAPRPGIRGIVPGPFQGPGVPPASE
jgi:hypothetical protein